MEHVVYATKQITSRPQIKNLNEQSLLKISKPMVTLHKQLTSHPIHKDKLQRVLTQKKSDYVGSKTRMHYLNNVM